MHCLHAQQDRGAGQQGSAIVYVSLHSIQEAYTAAARTYEARARIFERLLSLESCEADAQLVKEAAGGVPDAVRARVWSRVLGVRRDKAREAYAECAARGCREEVGRLWMSGMLLVLVASVVLALIGGHVGFPVVQRQAWK